MTQEEWLKIQSDTVTKMIEHVQPFVTPISYPNLEGYGTHHGTGAYFEEGKDRFVITNEHVAIKNSEFPLCCQFFQMEDIVPIQDGFYLMSAPIDIAISRISSEIWDQYAIYAQAIPLQRFAKKHDPVERELLFFIGYSGARSTFHFNTLISRGTPYLTQECPVPTGIENVDSEHHFSLFYKPDVATSIDGTSFLPDPHGFSGSLIWDTKRAYCLQKNISWDPSMAEITGIVWGWPSSDACLLATKVEHFRLTNLISLAEKNN